MSMAIGKEPFFALAASGAAPAQVGARIDGDAERLGLLFETFRLPEIPITPGPMDPPSEQEIYDGKS